IPSRPPTVQAEASRRWYSKIQRKKKPPKLPPLIPGRTARGGYQRCGAKKYQSACRSCGIGGKHHVVIFDADNSSEMLRMRGREGRRGALAGELDGWIRDALETK